MELRRRLLDNSDLMLVAGVIGVLVVLLTPVPPAFLDFLLLTNFALALLILMITFYAQRPADFSTFPSLLLIATLFRLSLNVSATRLILGDADAGRVIGAVGEFAVQGNYVIGIIVFLILVVVQYVVITSGAQRVAEVAARFTLDALPGQQMSIDADLNMGLIDAVEARARRKTLEREANFYGSMDGASKFVKGDAIAGIIILIIDILGGLAIGVAQRGMPWGEALQTYTLLTIGDGIVTQMPALVISVGTGIIITRSASDARLSSEIIKQAGAYPRTLWLVALALLAMTALPGIPVLPGVALAGLLAVFASLAGRQRSDDQEAQDGDAARKAAADDDVYETLGIEALEVRVGANLIRMASGAEAQLLERIATLRKQHAQDFGFVVPKLRLKDDGRLESNTYQICIFGVAIAKGELVPDRVLAISPGGSRRALTGIETRDPAYGLPAFWVLAEERADARAAGYTLVDPPTVLITHLNEVIRRQFAALLTRAETERLLARLRPEHGSLLDEIIPQVLSLGEVQKVLQNLLRERVSIRNLESILEVLADAGRQSKDAEQLTEAVRQRLGSAICQGLMNKSGELAVLTLEPSIEHTLAAGLRLNGERTQMVIEPRLAEQVLAGLGAQVDRMMKGDAVPVLLCAPELRRHIRKVTERVLPHLVVLSLAEVPNGISLKSFAMVTV